MQQSPMKLYRIVYTILMVIALIVSIKFPIVLFVFIYATEQRWAWWAGILLLPLTLYNNMYITSVVVAVLLFKVICVRCKLWKIKVRYSKQGYHS